MVVEIVPLEIHHEGGPTEARAPHRCEPRILFQCVACRQHSVFCTASEAAIARSLDLHWRCADCEARP